VARLQYLVDTSVFARLPKPAVAAAFAPHAAAGRVALCAPVAFELGYAARSHDDYRELTDRLAAFAPAPVTDGDHQRAMEVQRALSARGQHRALSLVDALVAAVAEARGLTILHYDADYELIADVTGQAHEWIVERGRTD
jgi:predicted nucleic acid-binding protein